MFVRLADGNHVLEYVLMQLRKAMEGLRGWQENHHAMQLRNVVDAPPSQEIRLAQFDVTQDLLGTFYALEDWQEKWQELC